MNTEQTNQDMTPDEAAASLAFATRLSEGMMQPQQEEATTEEPVTEETPQEPQEDPRIEELQSKLEAQGTEMEDFKNEIRYSMKKEMEALRKDIKSALEND